MTNFLVHIGIGVTDLNRSVRFYCEALGFIHDRDLAMTHDQVSAFLELTPPGGDLKAVYLYLGDLQIELMQFEPAGMNRVRDRRMNEVGLTHLSIGVPDVPAALERVRAAGGEVATAIDDWAAMVRDPDGQYLELLSEGYATEFRNSGRSGAAKVAG